MQRKSLFQALAFTLVIALNPLVTGVQATIQKNAKKSAAPPPAVKAKTYTIVPGESSIGVFVAKAGIASFVAHDHNMAVKTLSGQVIVPAAGAAQGSLELDMDARSLVIYDKISDKDKAEITKSMNDVVLESGKYPKITFRSTGVSNFTGSGLTVNGNLTLHGTTKPIAIPVALAATPQQLRATGKYTLRQTDFGITPYSALGGTVKVKNEVVISFNIIAR